MAVFSASSFPVTIPPTKVYCLVRLIQPQFLPRGNGKGRSVVPHVQIFSATRSFAAWHVALTRATNPPLFPFRKAGWNGDFVKLHAEALNSRFRRA